MYKGRCTVLPLFDPVVVFFFDKGRVVRQKDKQTPSLLHFCQCSRFWPIEFLLKIARLERRPRPCAKKFKYLLDKEDIVFGSYPSSAPTIRTNGSTHTFAQDLSLFFF